MRIVIIIKRMFLYQSLILITVNSQYIQAQNVLERNQLSNEYSLTPNDSSSTKWLDEIVITAAAPLFTKKDNRLIVNVSTTHLSTAGTAIDVIKHLPGISIKDNVMTVFSKGVPVIYMDNRRLYDPRELQQLQSTDIAAVELITQPDAKYDAEGQAVLIIKRKKNEANRWAIKI